MDNRAKKRKRIYTIVFIVYLCLLIYFLFFSDMLGRKETYDDYRYNIEPFKEIKRFWNSALDKNYTLFIVNIIGNMLLFIPFGYLFTVVMEDRRVRPGMSFVDTFLAALLTILLVETCQLITKVGVFDIDDIILNTIGAVVGYMIYILVRHRINLRKAAKQRKKA